jgi:hypothetical protein
MSVMFLSTGLAPVVGTIDWLTAGRRKLIFSAGLAPVECTIGSAIDGQPPNHALDRGKPGTGRSALRGLSLSRSIITRRGQAPDVAEQKRYRWWSQR